MADEHKMDSDDDPDNDDQFYPPSPKRTRVNEDSLLAYAVLVAELPLLHFQRKNSGLVESLSTLN